MKQKQKKITFQKYFIFNKEGQQLGVKVFKTGTEEVIYENSAVTSLESLHKLQEKYEGQFGKSNIDYPKTIKGVLEESDS